MTESAPDPALHRAANRRRAVQARSATFGAAPPGRRTLVVLLPSADAATMLLLCAEAAELAG